MPSATINQAAAAIAPTKSKVFQLVYICCLLSAVNESCREMKGITYFSLSNDKDRVLTPLQVFLCKLAQICDNAKGGDTITALVALRGANGPGYLFASNNRKEHSLNDTKRFLTELLTFVGVNPGKLAEKALKKQVLWRILEFNFPRVDYYLKRIVTSLDECISSYRAHASLDGDETFFKLKQLQAKASFPCDMAADNNAKPKFLSDCENLIRAIQFARESGFSKVFDERANAGDSEASRSWCELRHYLGRLHSYRQATECIVGASKEWPRLFSGFTVGSIPSSRHVRVSLPVPIRGAVDIFNTAFQDMDSEEYMEHIQTLQQHNLDRNIQRRLQKKTIQQLVHCEVNLEDFLVRGKTTKPSDYWENSMFIATSKPPCRLCYYYFNDPDNNFQVQSSHMNVYEKWRLPDVYKEQGQETIDRREELLEDLIEQLQTDTLHAVKEKITQGKRNDSRTDTRTGRTTVLEHDHGERSDTRNYYGHYGMEERSDQGTRADIMSSERSTFGVGDELGFVDVGAAI